MARSFDVIVVGLGAMGSAACRHLAGRSRGGAGCRVLGLEQFSIPNAMGSSHGESRMIRLCYYEHPDYVPLLHRAYELWRQLERDAGQTLLHMTGGVYMGDAEGEFVGGSLRAAREHGLPHEFLDAVEVRRRFPQFTLPSQYVALMEPNAGILLPEEIVAAHAELALRDGAELRAFEPLVSWSAAAGGSAVEVVTTRDRYSAGTVIFCGGAWSEQLIAGLDMTLGVPLHVTRQVLGWVWPRRPELFALGALPVWAIDHPDGTQHYGFPMLPFSGRPGFKIAHHFKGERTTAAAIDRTPRPEDERDFREALRQFIPDADGPLLSMAVCMYTNSPDSHFIIDRHPSHENVIVACGFSGHGFKFASVIGEALADLALTGRTSLPIEFLGLSRFANARAC